MKRAKNRTSGRVGCLSLGILPKPSRFLPVSFVCRDTAGQERFRTITTAYYRGAMVSLLFQAGFWFHVGRRYARILTYCLWEFSQLQVNLGPYLQESLSKNSWCLNLFSKVKTSIVEAVLVFQTSRGLKPFSRKLSL